MCTCMLQRDSFYGGLLPGYSLIDLSVQLGELANPSKIVRSVSTRPDKQNITSLHAICTFILLQSPVS